MEGVQRSLLNQTGECSAHLRVKPSISLLSPICGEIIRTILYARYLFHKTIKLFNFTISILPFSNQTAELQWIPVNLWNFLGWRSRSNSHSYPNVCERLPYLLSDDWTTAWQSEPGSNYTVSIQDTLDVAVYMQRLFLDISDWQIWKPCFWRRHCVTLFTAH